MTAGNPPRKRAPAEKYDEDHSLLGRVIASWPDRLWLNCLVFIGVFFALVLYYFGPLGLASPFPIFVAGLWLLIAAGVLVYVMDTIRDRRRSTR